MGNIFERGDELPGRGPGGSQAKRSDDVPRPRNSTLTSIVGVTEDVNIFTGGDASAVSIHGIA